MKNTLASCVRACERARLSCELQTRFAHIYPYRSSALRANKQIPACARKQARRVTGALWDHPRGYHNFNHPVGQTVIHKTYIHARNGDGANTFRRRISRRTAHCVTSSSIFIVRTFFHIVVFVVDDLALAKLREPAPQPTKPAQYVQWYRLWGHHNQPTPPHHRCSKHGANNSCAGPANAHACTLSV